MVPIIRFNLISSDFVHFLLTVDFSIFVGIFLVFISKHGRTVINRFLDFVLRIAYIANTVISMIVAMISLIALTASEKRCSDNFSSVVILDRILRLPFHSLVSIRQSSILNESWGEIASIDVKSH